GYVWNDPELVGADNELWPGPLDTSAYSTGGNGFESDGHNWGDGGDASFAGSAWILDSGQDGFALFHYRLGTSLASTGVDANSIGMTAGALTLGGIALAVVAAARRARRNK
ncbi:MAG: hypothetical protein ACKOWN_07490, partial [Microbacteriaceae bacterium]